MIVNAGGVAAVVDYIASTRGNVRLPGIMMLGYTAAHTESLAMAVIISKVETKRVEQSRHSFISRVSISCPLHSMKKQKIISWLPPLGPWVCSLCLCPSLSLSLPFFLSLLESFRLVVLIVGKVLYQGSLAYQRELERLPRIW